MDRTGMLRGKENVELPDPVKMSEHAVKVRDARDARRKRILARSSERLAFITGEANAIPTSPLLDHKSNSLNSLSSTLNQDTHYSSDQESTIKKSILFNEHEQIEAHNKERANNRENSSRAGAAIAQSSKNTSKTGADIVQPLKDEGTTEAHEPVKESPTAFKSKFSNCIKQSRFPRLLCATCIALAVLAIAGTGVGIYFGSKLGFAQSKTLSMVCYSLAAVMLVDLLLFMGAFFLFPGTEHSNMIRNRKAIANQTTHSILLHLLLSISLDCSVSASLVSGGFLVLSKYFSSHNS